MSLVEQLQITPRRTVAWIDGESRLKFPAGFRDAVLPGQGGAPVVERIGIAGVEAKRFGVAADRLVELATGGKQQAEVVVGCGEIRLACDGAFELLNGIGGLI